MTCENDTHRVAQDKFAALPGVRRTVPGDLMCLDCGEPLPYWWRGGKPVPVDVPSPPVWEDGFRA